MQDERGEQLGLGLQSSQGVPNLLTQFNHVGGGQVAQRTIFRPRPDFFVWVAVRGVAWEVLYHYLRMAVFVDLANSYRPGS